jgi:hypothetical protein
VKPHECGSTVFCSDCGDEDGRRENLDSGLCRSGSKVGPTEVMFGVVCSSFSGQARA